MLNFQEISGIIIGVENISHLRNINKIDKSNFDKKELDHLIRIAQTIPEDQVRPEKWN